MQTIQAVISIFALAASGLANAGDTDASRALTHSVQASGHASGSAAHAIAASGKTTSAVIAVPLSVGGVALSAAGAVSAAVAGELSNAARQPAGPLLITDETITTTPPDKALKTPTVAR